MKVEKEITIVTIFLLAFVVLYAILNYLTPLVADDCGYSMSHTLKTVLMSQWHEYFRWSGRFFAHSTASVMGGVIGKSVFNVLNAMMTGLFVVLLARCADRERQFGSVVSIVVAAVLVWFCLPDQYITQFMIAGSCNYIWASVINLLFICLFFNRLNAPFQKKYLILFGIGMFAFLAGAWSEMYSICVIPALFVWLLSHRKQYTKMQMTCFVLYVLGAVFLVLAPGNMQHYFLLNDEETHIKLTTRIVNSIVFVGKSPLPWLWLAIVLLKVLQKKSDFWINNIFYIIAISVSVLFTMVSGASYSRTFYAVYVLTFVLLLKLLPDIGNKWLKVCVVTVIAVSIGVDFVHETRVMSSKKQAIDKLICSMPDNEMLPWTGQGVSRKSITKNVLSWRPNNWKNRAFCHYYDKPSFGLIPQEVYDAIIEKNVCETNYTDNYCIVCNDTGHVQRMKITYSDEDLWSWPSKVARLIWPSMIDRYYLSPEDVPLHQLFLKQHQGVETTFVNLSNTDFFCTVYYNKQYITFYSKKLLHKGNLEAKTIEFYYNNE